MEKHTRTLFRDTVLLNHNVTFVQEASIGLLLHSETISVVIIIIAAASEVGAPPSFGPRVQIRPRNRLKVIARRYRIPEKRDQIDV